MKILIAMVLLSSACAFDEVADESEVDQESVPTATQGVAGQGTSMQGTSMQGTSMQGTSMQGTSMQGTSMQGATSGGAGVSSAGVNGTALTFWKKVGGTWEQRFPNKICYWNSKKTILDHCTSFALTSSPVAGSVWPSTFIKDNGDGTTTSITVMLTVQSVVADTSTAMFPLNGSGATGALSTCENPNNCRVNSDLFLYNVMTDVKDTAGNNVALCPVGQNAFALAGTWSTNGTFAPSTTQFTFACTNGTIAKCTRWGYRPWASAIKTNESVASSLADYHQACVRAAAADYCSTGHSFTKNGTLVDVYDYNQASDHGFIPHLRGFIYGDTTASAFVWESYFDKYGAFGIDHARYAELNVGANSIDSICPGRFQTTFTDDVHPGNYVRWSPNLVPGQVHIDSTPACGHSEFTVGKWLHEGCSYCTGHAPLACNDPTHGWDQSCVDWANANKTYYYQPCWSNGNRTANHSECTAGTALNKYDTGCTLKVCLSNPECCTSTNGWTQACVNTANATCTGGRETRLLGFCGNDAVIVGGLN